MMVTKLIRVAAACATLGATVGIAALTGGTAGASYGAGTEYQVEISANVNNLSGAPLYGKTDGSGGGFWFWAALTPPSSPTATSGTVDYQESDCVHNVPVAPNGDVHNGGEATYTDSNGVLTITGVMTGLGPISITIPDAYGSYGAGDVGLGPFTGLLTNVKAEVAP